MITERRPDFTEPRVFGVSGLCTCPGGAGTRAGELRGEGRDSGRDGCLREGGPSAARRKHICSGGHGPGASLRCAVCAGLTQKLLPALCPVPCEWELAGTRDLSFHEAEICDHIYKGDHIKNITFPTDCQLTLIIFIFSMCPQNKLRKRETICPRYDRILRKPKKSQLKGYEHQ